MTGDDNLSPGQKAGVWIILIILCWFLVLVAAWASVAFIRWAF